MYFGYMNQLLKMMVTMKQIEQFNQICNNPQQSHPQGHVQAIGTSVNDKAVNLADAYRAYGEYCTLFGLTPSQEGFKVWYEENIQK